MIVFLWNKLGPAEIKIPVSEKFSLSISKSPIFFFTYWELESALSKIKLCYDNDTLSIVIHGVKKISLFDLYDKKKNEYSIFQWYYK